MFDALTSRREYPKYFKGVRMDSDPMPITQVVSVLRSGSGSHFDPRVVDVFLPRIPEAISKFRNSHFPAEYVDRAFAELDAGKTPALEPPAG